MNKEKFIYKLALEEFKTWPKNLKNEIVIPWLKTIEDDKNNLISLLPFKIWRDSNFQNQITKNQVAKLGLINLYLWTAANLQDDVIDEKDCPKKFIPLANACFMSAQKIMWQNFNQFFHFWQKALMISDEANLREIKYPKKIPKSNLMAADKSLFLLSTSLVLIKTLKWPQKDQSHFLLAGKLFLATKQIADDVYDFKEDWRVGKRNFAHRNLKKLPKKSELKNYYQRQAQKIIKLSNKCREQIKKISSLKKRNCFNKYLKTLEENSKKALL